MNNVIQVNSFQIDLSRMVLDSNAEEELLLIANSDSASRPLLAADFIASFGSHVLLTPQTTGGIFRTIATITSWAELTIEDKVAALTEASTYNGGIAGKAAVGPKVNVGGSHGEKKENIDANGSQTRTAKYSTHYSHEVVGPQVLDFNAFQQALAMNSKTHCLVSNGYDVTQPHTWEFKPVWECIVAPGCLTQLTSSQAMTVARALREEWLDQIISGIDANDTFLLFLLERCLKRSLPNEVPNWRQKWVKDCAERFRDYSERFTNLQKYFVNFDFVSSIHAKLTPEPPPQPTPVAIEDGYYLICSSASSENRQAIQAKLSQPLSLVPTESTGAARDGQLFFICCDKTGGKNTCTITFVDDKGELFYLQAPDKDGQNITYGPKREASVMQKWLFFRTDDCYEICYESPFLDVPNSSVKFSLNSIDNRVVAGSLRQFWWITPPEWTFISVFSNGTRYFLNAPDVAGVALNSFVSTAIRALSPISPVIQFIEANTTPYAWLTNQRTTYDYQLWIFEDGYIKNKAHPNFVLTVEPEKKYLVLSCREEIEEGKLQKWTFVNGSLRLLAAPDYFIGAEPWTNFNYLSGNRFFASVDPKNVGNYGRAHFGY